MGDEDQDAAALLRAARAKAEALLAGLVAQRDDLDRAAAAANLAPDAAAAGREAFARAIDAARRTLAAVEGALGHVAAVPAAEPVPTPPQRGD